GAYSFEAGNVRHEHEWKVWEDVKLPDDKVILRVWSATPPMSSSTPSSSPNASCVLQTWSAGSASSPRPIAGSAAASIRKSPGPSSKRWSRGPRSPLATSGGEEES